MAAVDKSRIVGFGSEPPPDESKPEAASGWGQWTELAKNYELPAIAMPQLPNLDGVAASLDHLRGAAADAWEDAPTFEQLVANSKWSPAKGDSPSLRPVVSSERDEPRESPEELALQVLDECSDCALDHFLEQLPDHDSREVAAALLIQADLRGVAVLRVCAAMHERGFRACAELVSSGGSEPLLRCRDAYPECATHLRILGLLPSLDAPEGEPEPDPSPFRGPDLLSFEAAQRVPADLLAFEEVDASPGRDLLSPEDLLSSDPSPERTSAERTVGPSEATWSPRSGPPSQPVVLGYGALGTLHMSPPRSPPSPVPTLQALKSQSAPAPIGSVGAMKVHGACGTRGPYQAPRIEATDFVRLDYQKQTETRDAFGDLSVFK